jgi:hypothetical protein
LGKGNDQQKQAAERLKLLDRQEAPTSELLGLLEELRDSSLLPQPAWFCLAVDVIGLGAFSRAAEAVGDEDEYFRENLDLQNQLSHEIQQVVGAFLKRHPLPMSYLHAAIDSVNDYILDEMDRELAAPSYHDQLEKKRQELMPDTLRRFGCGDLADLLLNNPQEFKRLKEEGERWLIGMTYEEEGRKSLEGPLGKSSG